MAEFGPVVRRLQERHGMSLGRLAELTHYDKGYLSKVVNGHRPVSEELAQACDAALGARGELVAAARLDAVAARDLRPAETGELIERLQASDVTADTLERLDAVVFELCCDYPYRDATELRGEAQRWLRRIETLLRRPVGLRQHGDLLVGAGWLALLIGCLEYDLGLRLSAEYTRVAARQLGDEAGQPAIVGWAAELAAWFALTQGRYPAVLAAARQGRYVAGRRGVSAQLYAQEAKALARMGDVTGVRQALDCGGVVIDALPAPDRPEHHFVVDPAKWNFYAMDAYRLAGDEVLSTEYAHQVLAAGTRPDGSERAPMRMAEARLTLGVAAARSGRLDEAVGYGQRALATARRSLPSLVMVASELDAELGRRFPAEPDARAFRELVWSIRDVTRAS